jgi:hypothetical protein
MRDRKISEARAKAARTRKRNAAYRRAKQRKTAFGRLEADGSSSNENIRRRLQWLASEWRIPAENLPKLISTQSVVDFAKKYDDVELDWLLWGDLKGLQRMMGKRPWHCTNDRTTKRIMAKYDLLTPEQQQIVHEEADRILAERAAEEPEPAA